MTDYPQWVRERACELGNAIAGSPVYSPKNVGERGYYALTALADLILKYEKAPVDPDEALALEAVKQAWPHLNNQGDDKIKDAGCYIAALAAIKLARERNAL